MSNKREEIIKSMQERQELAKKKIREKLDQVPEIHWQILRYANNHTKEEVLAEYPDHVEFINSIHWAEK